MRLKSVNVSGLFGRFDHSITMSDEGLTFIHSLNGVGKSTAMKIICDIFKGDMESLSETPFDYAILEFDNGDVLTVVNDNGADITLETLDGRSRKMYDNDLKMMFSVTYLSPERNIVTMDDGRILPAIDVLLSSFRSQLEDARDDRTLIPYSGQRAEMSDEGFIDWCSDLDDSLRYIASVGISPDLPMDISFPPTLEEYQSSKKRYEDVAYSIDKWTEEHFPFALSLTTFLNIINGMFTEKKIVIDDRGLMSAVISDGEKGIKLPLNKLSAGEKQLIIIFMRILFDARPGSLVILDEPEISLHVSWQKRLGPILLDIISMKDLQIMVATHSPVVIHDRWDLTCELRAERA